MILSQQIAGLAPLQQELSQLVGSYQRGDAAFPDQVLAWLTETERKMAQLHVPGCSEMATLRGRIVKAADTLHLGAEKPPRSQVRAARATAAMDALERAEAMMRSANNDAEERLRRFEDKLCEGMTALLLKVELPPYESPRTAWLSLVWHIMNEFQPTRPLALYLASSLTMVDRLYLLDVVISRMTPPGPRMG